MSNEQASIQNERQFKSAVSGSKNATTGTPVEPMVRLRYYVGVFDSEWYFWAEKTIPFVRVPCAGERIERDDEFYDLIEAVTWFHDGSVRVECDYVVGGDGEEYGRTIAGLERQFRQQGWDIEIPDDRTLLAI